MQFLAFGGCRIRGRWPRRLPAAGSPAVLYEDVNDPRGVALLTLSEDPAVFLDRVRPLLNAPPFDGLAQKPEYTMLGRTYSIGYEPDLQEVLLDRPRRTVLNPRLALGRLVSAPPKRPVRAASAEEQRVILAEHGAIGMSFGAGDYAHDIRLACHGLDKDDNDFVVGLSGRISIRCPPSCRRCGRRSRRRSIWSGSARSSSAARSGRAPARRRVHGARDPRRVGDERFDVGRRPGARRSRATSRPSANTARVGIERIP